MKKTPIHLSFMYAFRGVIWLIWQERNARIHCIVTMLVLIAGYCFDISRYEWAVVIFSVVGVFAVELINTCIEDICDVIEPEKSEVIMKIKDMSAGAVLVISAGAVLAGLIVFVPKILHVLGW